MAILPVLAITIVPSLGRVILLFKSIEGTKTLNAVLSLYIMWFLGMDIYFSSYILAFRKPMVKSGVKPLPVIVSVSNVPALTVVGLMAVILMACFSPFFDITPVALPHTRRFEPCVLAFAGWRQCGVRCSVSFFYFFFFNM